MPRLLHDIAKRCPDGKLPSSLLWLDSETSGVNPYSDRILQFGMLYVRDGKPAGPSFSVIVKQPAGFVVPQGAFAVHGIGRERMDKEGIPEAELFPVLHEEIKGWQDNGGMIAGHNILSFDCPLWEESLRRLGIEFRFKDACIDTGMLVKAAQLGMYFRDNEPLRHFYRRVSEVFAKGVYWSLDRHCFKTYGLEKYGCSKDRAHDAGVDCELAHWTWVELQKELNRVG